MGHHARQQGRGVLHPGVRRWPLPHEGDQSSFKRVSSAGQNPVQGEQPPWRSKNSPQGCVSASDPRGNTGGLWSLGMPPPAHHWCSRKSRCTQTPTELFFFLKKEAVQQYQSYGFKSTNKYADSPSPNPGQGERLQPAHPRHHPLPSAQ